MISNIIINILLAVAGFLIGFLELFGPATLPAQITESMPQFAQFYTTLNGIFPVDSVLAIIAIQVSIELSILTYRLIKWTYQKIPGIS